MTGPIDWRAWMRRPLGRALSAALAALILIAPAWLFADALGRYRLYSDDFAYIAGSRSLSRTVASLFRPHNTHIVPTWRVLTFSAVASAGNLAALPAVLAKFTYAALVLSMLLIGRLVAKESGRASVGLAAMAATGMTSVVWSASTWYSAGQTLWAGIGVLAMLDVLQSWRIRGGAWRLLAAAAWAWVAGGFWTIGHAAGPVGALYLWADGRPIARKAAAVPILATALAVAVALGIGGRKIDGSVSFHGRSSREALDVRQGASHTLQAIPENLVFGNLGLTPITTEAQAAALCAAILAIWAHGLWKGRRPTPLEWSGAALSLSSYLVEWSFRGYFTFENLRGIVPWYDTIPHLGAVLFASCWWAARRDGRLPASVSPTSRASALAILALMVAQLLTHQTRVDQLTNRNIPTPRWNGPAGAQSPPRRSQALQIADTLVLDQRRDLERLDRVQAVGRENGIGREAIAGRSAGFASRNCRMFTRPSRCSTSPNPAAKTIRNGLGEC